MISFNLIDGNAHRDKRGKLIFFNNVNLKEVVRMYEIRPSSIETVRGWQGHKKEQKWFYCSAGSFTVYLAPISYFSGSNKESDVQIINLESDRPAVLHITGGYATAFKANRDNATLLVFSDFSVEESVADDFRYSLDEWPINI